MPENQYVTESYQIYAMEFFFAKIVNDFYLFYLVLPKSSIMDVLQGLKYGPKLLIHSAQEMKSSIKGFFHKCDQIRGKLRILVTFTKEIRKKLHFCAGL